AISPRSQRPKLASTSWTVRRLRSGAKTTKSIFFASGVTNSSFPICSDLNVYFLTQQPTHKPNMKKTLAFAIACTFTDLAAFGGEADDKRETYVIEPVHSSVNFSSRHFVAKTTGSFTRFEGK